MTYICDHYMISRIQRNREKASGLGEEGTMGYQEKGCYVCIGINPLCNNYQKELRLTRSKLNPRLIIGGKDL